MPTQTAIAACCLALQASLQMTCTTSAVCPLSQLSLHMCLMLLTVFMCAGASRESPPFRKQDSIQAGCCAPQACTPDGTVYDIVNIVSYIQKFKRHPTNGEPLALRDIITLNFAKNAEGKYHCPVLHKVGHAAAPFCCALAVEACCWVGSAIVTAGMPS